MSACVTLEEILAAASVRCASLVPETSGYLTLAVADAISRLPLRIEDRDILLTPEGALSLARRGEVVSPAESARRLRDLLARLLAVSAGTMPGLVAAARPRAESSRGADALVDELEAALIPVNRQAARRALARLSRETLRAREAGRLRRVLRAAARASAAQAAAPGPAPQERLPAPGTRPVSALAAVAPEPAAVAPEPAAVAPEPAAVAPEPAAVAPEPAASAPEPADLVALAMEPDTAPPSALEPAPPAPATDSPAAPPRIEADAHHALVAAVDWDEGPTTEPPSAVVHGASDDPGPDAVHPTPAPDIDLQDGAVDALETMLVSFSPEPAHVAAVAIPPDPTPTTVGVTWSELPDDPDAGHLPPTELTATQAFEVVLDAEAAAEDDPTPVDGDDGDMAAAVLAAPEPLVAGSDTTPVPHAAAGPAQLDFPFVEMAAPSAMGCVETTMLLDAEIAEESVPIPIDVVEPVVLLDTYTVETPTPIDRKPVEMTDQLDMCFVETNERIDTDGSAGVDADATSIEVVLDETAADEAGQPEAAAQDPGLDMDPAESDARLDMDPVESDARLDMDPVESAPLDLAWLEPPGGFDAQLDMEPVESAPAADMAALSCLPSEVEADEPSYAGHTLPWPVGLGMAPAPQPKPEPEPEPEPRITLAMLPDVPEAEPAERVTLDGLFGAPVPTAVVTAPHIASTSPPSPPAAEAGPSTPVLVPSALPPETRTQDLPPVEAILRRAARSHARPPGAPPQGTSRVDELLARFAAQHERDPARRAGARSMKALAGLEPTPPPRSAAAHERVTPAPVAPAAPDPGDPPEPARSGASTAPAAPVAPGGGACPAAGAPGARRRRARWLALLGLALLCAGLLGSMRPDLVASLAPARAAGAQPTAGGPDD